jgi:hypothetical protein
LVMGIAAAGTNMTLQSAVPATILIARAFMGHLLLLRSRNKPAKPCTGEDRIMDAAGGRSRSIEDRTVILAYGAPAASLAHGLLVDERLTEQPVETFCGQWLLRKRADALPHRPREAKRVVSAASLPTQTHQGRKTLGSNVLYQCNRKTGTRGPSPVPVPRKIMQLARDDVPLSPGQHRVGGRC